MKGSPGKRGRLRADQPCGKRDPLFLFDRGQRSWPRRSGVLTEVIGSLTAEAVKNEGNLVVEMSPVSIKEKVDVVGAVPE